jgi:tetrahydromethanopterin S-methyltransferase subunit A
MLERRGELTDTVPDDLMAQLFENHIQEVLTWMNSQPNIDYIEFNYNDALQNPEKNIKRVVDFLDCELDEAKMLKVIEPRLYRQRK